MFVPLRRHSRSLLTPRRIGPPPGASKDGEFKRFDLPFACEPVGARPNGPMAELRPSIVAHRQVSSFRDSIEKGGKFAPEKGRYHL